MFDALKRGVGNLLPYLLLVTIWILATTGLGVRDLLTQYRLSTQDTEVVVATVSENVRIRRPKSSRYYLTLQYAQLSDKQAPVIETRREVEPSLAREHPIGSSIRVRYVKETPGVADVVDSNLLRNKGYSFLGMSFLIGLLSIIFAGMIRYARSQMPSPGLS